MIFFIFFNSIERVCSLFLAFLSFFLSLFCPLSAGAHPHVFITTSFALQFDTQGLAGIHVFWGFDDMYSAMIFDDFDKNKDGRLSPSELETLTKAAAKSLPQFNFFTHIHVDGKPMPVSTVKNLQIKHAKGLLSYDFIIPCPVPIVTGSRTVKISPYDPDFFSAMFFSKKQPVILENAEGFIVRSTIGRDPDKKIWYDQVHPEALTLTLQKKP